MEAFIDPEGQLIFNEMAPRPHNSFHWTIEGCVTSQFAQLVRTRQAGARRHICAAAGRWTIF